MGCAVEKLITEGEGRTFYYDVSPTTICDCCGFSSLRLKAYFHIRDLLPGEVAPMSAHVVRVEETLPGTDEKIIRHICRDVKPGASRTPCFGMKDLVDAIMNDEREFHSKAKRGEALRRAQHENEELRAENERLREENIDLKMRIAPFQNINDLMDE